jgi:hypothetical protein
LINTFTEVNVVKNDFSFKSIGTFLGHPEIQRAGVQYTISSTIEALKGDPDRRWSTSALIS